MMDDALQTRPSLHNKETSNQPPQMDGKGVLVIGHFFWHIHGTREASKIPLPIKVFSNEVLTNCPRGQGNRILLTV